MQITVNAVNANVEKQRVVLEKEPGQPIMCTVVITTDAAPPNDKVVVGPFPLSDVPSGPSNAECAAIRNYALSLKGL